MIGRRPPPRSPASVLALALAMVGMGASCGGPEAEEPPARPPESAESVPELPPGWTQLENEAQGFALGVPPGWRRGGDCLGGATEPDPTTTLCSPDRLVTLRISSDRTNEALELSPGKFALRVLEGLGEAAYDRLRPGKPQPFKGHYDGAKVTGAGTSRASGVRQDVAVVVLRRDRLANFTAVIAANADRPTGPAVTLAERSLRTLRSRPR